MPFFLLPTPALHRRLDRVHRYIAHVILASASILFLSAFSAGPSPCFGAFGSLVRFDGNIDRRSDVVERAVDVDRMEKASFSDLVSMLEEKAVCVLRCGDS